MHELVAYDLKSDLDPKPSFMSHVYNVLDYTN